MRAPTPTDSEPERRGLRPSAFGRPSPALIARADRGHAQFLAHDALDNHTGGHDMARHQ